MGRTFCCGGQHNNHHQRAFHVHFGDSTKEITFASGLASDRCAERAPSLNFSQNKKTKAALRGIKVVPTNNYAQGEERPLWKHSVYKNRWYFSKWAGAK